ncbi:unnamed protein product, partial [Bubo scandiacus]
MGVCFSQLWAKSCGRARGFGFSGFLISLLQAAFQCSRGSGRKWGTSSRGGWC